MKSLITIISLTLVATITYAQPSVDKGKVFYEAKKYPEAENIFKSVGERTVDYAAAQYYLGRIAFDKKEYNDAVEYFEKATEANPKSGEYFNWLGDTYATIGKNASLFRQMSVGPKALKAWEKATQLDQKNIDARVSLVGAYVQAPSFMGGGETKAKAMANEAFPLLDEALKKTPDHHLYNYWYGKSSAMTGLQLDRGEDCLQKYLTFTPKEGEPSIAGAYMRLGQIKEKKRSNPEAKKNYEMALKLDSNLKGAREGLGRVSK